MAKYWARDGFGMEYLRSALDPLSPSVARTRRIGVPTSEISGTLPTKSSCSKTGSKSFESPTVMTRVASVERGGSP